MAPSNGRGFPSGSDGKESACNAGDLGLILGQEDPWRREWPEKIALKHVHYQL